MARLAQTLDESASVVRVHAVVPGGGGHQQRRVRCLPALGFHVVVSREPVQKVPPVRRVRIAVLCHPAGARKQLAVPPHVQERHGAHHGAPQLRPANQHVADQ
eukprot:scaffold11182_cov122-Isochrysis_galbana.AAC.4